MTKLSHRMTEHFLQELLAVIHGDGGHYVSEHGMEKAITDAISEVGRLRQYPHLNHNFKVMYSDLVDTIMGDYGQVAESRGPLMAGKAAAAKAIEAIETLREVRLRLMMELRRGETSDNCPDITPNAAGLMEAVHQLTVEHEVSARRYTTNSISDWLESHPSDPLLELAFSEDPNPYRWLAEYLRREPTGKRGTDAL